MADDFPRRTFPCNECPWKRETEPGQFPASRYEDLRGTAPETPGEVLAAVMRPALFGCHKGEPGTYADLACAGWLAVAAHQHPMVRLAVIRGDLPASALEPGDGWPELYGSYDELAEANGAGHA